jgi:ribose transport system substrate-binding protein
MRKMLLLSLLASALGSGASAAQAADTVVVVMKGPGTRNPFWAAVQAGAEARGRELGVNVVVVAPPRESDVQGQIVRVEDQLARNVAAIAIAPTDPIALAPVLEQARKQGVGVVFIDTQGSNSGIPFIGTNSAAGAALAAEYICKNVPQGSEVAILQGILTQSTAQARGRGARQGLAACGMKIVAEQPADWDTDRARSVMENIAMAHPNLKAVFASNDNMALGAAQALKSAGLLSRVTVVGFDAIPDAVASVLAGEMNATVAQRPKQIGALGVESALNVKRGKKVPPVIDTGSVLVTKANAASYK